MSERQERSKFRNADPAALSQNVDPATFEKEKNDGDGEICKKTKEQKPWPSKDDSKVFLNFLSPSKRNRK